MKFSHIEKNQAGTLVAVFKHKKQIAYITQSGAETSTETRLSKPNLEIRIQNLEARSEDTSEEKKALAAFEKEGQ